MRIGVFGFKIFKPSAIFSLSNFSFLNPWIASFTSFASFTKFTYIYSQIFINMHILFIYTYTYIIVINNLQHTKCPYPAEVRYA